MSIFLIMLPTLGRLSAWLDFQQRINGIWDSANERQGQGVVEGKGQAAAEWWLEAQGKSTQPPSAPRRKVPPLPDPPLGCRVSTPRAARVASLERGGMEGVAGASKKGE